jgi:hypothetical protein
MDDPGESSAHLPHETGHVPRVVRIDLDAPLAEDPESLVA